MHLERGLEYNKQVPLSFRSTVTPKFALFILFSYLCEPFVTPSKPVVL